MSHSEAAYHEPESTAEATKMTRLDWITAAGDDRYARLAEALAGGFLGDVGPPPMPGGRAAALKHLQGYDLADYGRARNYLDAPVSRLSPYLRHGMLSIVEVRDAIRKRYGSEPHRGEEFLRQLAWRDFFDKVLQWHGPGLNDDLEDAKHHVPRASNLPTDIAAGNTGLPCIDGMLAELFADGTLHNHERLWFAAYLCHFRGISWKVGAQLFRQYLLDGDTASNSSSWQWVESTFAAKPYFMNKENIDKFSAGRWCRDCRVKCPFDADYDTLQRRLFDTGTAPLHQLGRMQANAKPEVQPLTRPSPANGVAETSDLIWVHDRAIHDRIQVPGATVAFVFDGDVARTEPPAFHRCAFVWDGLLELFAAREPACCEVSFGMPAEELAALAEASGATTIHVEDHPEPNVQWTIATLRKRFDVVVHPRPVLTTYAGEPKRFSRYWEKVAHQVLGYAPKSSPKKYHQ